jgi:hypothetical protein
VAEKGTLGIHGREERYCGHLARLVDQEAGVTYHIPAQVLRSISDGPGILLLLDLTVHTENAQVAVQETHLSRLHQVELEGLNYLLFQIYELLLPIRLLLFKPYNVND